MQSNTLLTGTSSLVFEGGQLSSGIQKGFLSGGASAVGLLPAGSSFEQHRRDHQPCAERQHEPAVQPAPAYRASDGQLNSRFIRIAKNDVKISDLVFRQQVIAAVATVVNLYSDLVSFNEDVKVRRQALALAEKLYNDNKKQVEIGTLAPIEIVRAEAEVARSQQELTQAETQVLQQETILKNYLSRTGLQSASIADARIVPTDQLRIPDVEQIEPVQDLVAKAMQNRPELAQTQLQIENARISLAGSKSQLLPSLNLVASAQNNGLAGQNNVCLLTQPPAPGSVQAEYPRSSSVRRSWRRLESDSRPQLPRLRIGFQLNVPLRNRTAQADIARDQLTLRQSEIAATPGIESDSCRCAERAHRVAAVSRALPGSSEISCSAGADARCRAEEVRARRLDYLLRDSGAARSGAGASRRGRCAQHVQSGASSAGSRNRPDPRRPIT